MGRPDYYEHRQAMLPARRAKLEQQLAGYRREHAALCGRSASTFKGGEYRHKEAVAKCERRIARTEQELNEVVDEMAGRLVPQRVPGGFMGTKIVLVKPEAVKAAQAGGE